MDDEKAIFRVPWIHAKKRDYNQERDAALFREWAIHSGELPTKTFQRERERERERESITETVCMVKSFLTQYFINEATR